jgi:DNA-binding transcriptional LysR family regulator
LVPALARLYLYYPSGRQLSPALAAFIAAIRAPSQAKKAALIGGNALSAPISWA